MNIPSLTLPKELIMIDKIFDAIRYLNTAYDKFKEPKRFYVYLFTVVLPVIFTLVWSTTLGILLIIALLIARGGFLAGWFGDIVDGDGNLHPSSRQEQIQGIDLVVSNPTWSRDFGIQVKCSYLRGRCVRTSPYYFEYEQVDRMILVDTEAMKLLCFDYPTFRTRFEGKDLIPIKELLQIPRAAPMQL